jgi:YD repeat-containing protein
VVQFLGSTIDLDFAFDTLDPVGNDLLSTDADGNFEQHIFDNLNREIKTLDGAGNATSAVYDAVGNVSVRYDALGQRTTYSYDNLIRLTQLQDALNGYTSTAYDKNGNMTLRIDALGRRTTYSYDTFNRLTQMQDAAGGYTTLVLDGDGNVLGRVDARGSTFRTTYSYDALNRLTQTEDPLHHLTTLAYDNNSNLTLRRDANGGRPTAEVHRRLDSDPIRDLPHGPQAVALILRSTQFHCQRCDRYFTPPCPHVAPGVHATERCLEQAARLIRFSDFATAAAAFLGVPEKTLERWYYDHVERQAQPPPADRKPIRSLGIDVLSLKKSTGSS